MSEQRLEEGEEEAGIICVYECSEIFVGIHYADEELVFQSIGDTRQEAIDDMLKTINHLPQALGEIGDDEAEFIDAVPLARKPQDGFTEEQIE